MASQRRRSVPSWMTARKGGQGREGGVREGHSKRSHVPSKSARIQLVQVFLSLPLSLPLLLALTHIDTHTHIVCLQRSKLGELLLGLETLIARTLGFHCLD